MPTVEKRFIKVRVIYRDHNGVRIYDTEGMREDFEDKLEEIVASFIMRNNAKTRKKNV